MSRLQAIGVAGILVTAWTLALTARQDGAASPSRGLGKPASGSDIAAQDLTVFPDGRGLPDGHGTAREGRTVYATRCAACHGSKGEGVENFPRLVGGRGTLTSKTPILTVGSYWPYATTLWDYNRRAMPYLQPGSLTTNEVYAVTAFLLHLNGIVAEDKILDQRTLPLVKMPNRDGFVADPRKGSHRSTSNAVGRP